MAKTFWVDTRIWDDPVVRSKADKIHGHAMLVLMWLFSHPDLLDLDDITFQQRPELELLGMDRNEICHITKLVKDSGLVEHCFSSGLVRWTKPRSSEMM